MSGIKAKGEAWIRVRDEVSNDIVTDTGWVSNVVTDVALYRLANGDSNAAPNIFIHESTAPGRTNRSILPFVYADQTPSQVRAPDTSVIDLATAVATYTVQFPAPTVARDINIVGLSFGALSSATANNEMGVIIAYTTLTTTVQQGTSQTADIQYRITWSFS